jgi:hypothetical protein
LSTTTHRCRAWRHLSRVFLGEKFNDKLIRQQKWTEYEPFLSFIVLEGKKIVPLCFSLQSS